MTLEKQLNQYLVLYPDEEKATLMMIDFLKTDSNCFERNNWSGHFTGSAWVMDKTREWFLMTHHRKLNLWLQLGGHADGNKNLKIYFELIKNVNSKQKTKDFHKLFFDALAKTNQDFKKSKEMINDNSKMELIFCKFNTKFFAENDIKIKAKYIH